MKLKQKINLDNLKPLREKTHKKAVKSITDFLK
ncbi:hypothetical protein ICW_03936 [Bacillus wiedmannii]|nr:hypothetical protein ICW_03936 [Bacillus wiedmannii]